MLALLVDDERLVRATVRSSLEDFGFRVEEAISADEAWQKIEGGLTPDLLVTDIRMPGLLDGIDLARKAQSMEAAPHIIIMSGFANGREPVKHGFSSYLRKPFTERQLYSMIEGRPTLHFGGLRVRQ